MRTKILGLLAVALLAGPLATAHAGSILSFSGGSNSPLTVTLQGDVSYTITSAPTASGPYFAFAGVAPLNFSQSLLSAAVQYQVGGGPVQSINSMGMAAGYLIFWPAAFEPFPVGTVITLFAGSATTFGNVTTGTPADGEFTSYIIDQNVNIVSAPGTTVPEPGTLALFGLGLAGLGFTRRRKMV